jgi:hypothetical protein
MNKDEERRKQENKDLVERMRRGDVLEKCKGSDTWFPVRPIIKKDEKEIERLYGKKKDNNQG